MTEDGRYATAVWVSDSFGGYSVMDSEKGWKAYIVNGEIVQEGFTFEDIDDATCKVTGYVGGDSVIEIPYESPEGKSVFAIADGAFAGQYDRDRGDSARMSTMDLISARMRLPAAPPCGRLNFCTRAGSVRMHLKVRRWEVQ